MYYRTLTHPHGFFMTNEQANLGFVRISKCGSTSAVNTLHLKNWMPFDRQHEVSRIFCCLRNPHERFLSSIFETISRAKFQGSLYGSVIVSPIILNRLSAIDQSSPKTITHDFIKIIEDHGFFDAHHEPMTNFLCNRHGEIEIDPQVFDVSDMTDILKQLTENNHSSPSTHFNSSDQKAEKINSEHRTSIYQVFKKIVRKGMNKMRPPQQQQQQQRRDSGQFVNLDKQRINIPYQSLKEMKNDPILNDFIQEFYPNDIKLHHALMREKAKKKHVTLEHLPNLSDLI